MKRMTIVLLVGIVVVGLAIDSVLFAVDQTEYAVVTQFGRVIRAVAAPGLNAKLPAPLQNVQRYDNRLQIYTPAVAEFLTRDKKNVMVESYVTYRIADPVVYMKALNTAARTEQRLNDVVFSELGVALGRYDLETLVNVAQEELKLDEMMAQVREVAGVKLEGYGLLLTDLRLKVLNFPERNQQSVFQRMRAEREKTARLYRSEGTEEASKIRAGADKDKTVLLSEAYEKSERIRGEGDAQAIRIYASAFQQDPEFYEFVRSLEAYEKLIDENTTLVVPSNSDLLKYLEKPGQR